VLVVADAGREHERLLDQRPAAMAVRAAEERR
jgi:hypothetical protein